MPALDDRVDQFLEQLEALLITHREANAKVGPEHASLYAVRQGVPFRALDVLELRKHLRRQCLAHQRLVQVSEGRQLSERDVLELARVLGIFRRAIKLPLQPRIKRSFVDHRQVELRSLCRKLLFQRDELLHTVNHLLHELHLREADALLVRNVPLTSDGGAVLACRAARLQVEARANLLELVRVLVQLRQHNHHAATQARAEVRRARAKETVVGVLHQLLAGALSRSLDRVRQLAEARKHALDVAAVLHGNDAALVLLVAPAQHSLGRVVEDAAPRRPVAARARRTQQLHRAGLLEQEAACLQRVLLLAGEIAKRKVRPLQVLGQQAEGFLQHCLHCQTVLLGGARRQREPRDVARRADARRLHVLGEQRKIVRSKDESLVVEVRLVRLRRRIEFMPALDDRVDDVLEQLEALLIAACEANTKVRPEYTCLNTV